MHSFRLTPGARNDLKDIWDWIAADNETAADQLVRDIEDACERIADHPQSGGRRPAWTARPVRFQLVRRIVFVVYEPDGRPVEILRIIHTARDIRALLAEGS